MVTLATFRNHRSSNSSSTSTSSNKKLNTSANNNDNNHNNISIIGGSTIVYKISVLISIIILYAIISSFFLIHDYTGNIQHILQLDNTIPVADVTDDDITINTDDSIVDVETSTSITLNEINNIDSTGSTKRIETTTTTTTSTDTSGTSTDSTQTDTYGTKKYTLNLYNSTERELFYKNHDTTIESKSKSSTNIPVGILSYETKDFFDIARQEIDTLDNVKRCLRYGGNYNQSDNINRRIFYGALIANEPWELIEIVANEAYSLYSGMIFIESNRTQNFSPRNYRRSNHSYIIGTLFGLDNPTTQIKIIQHTQEDSKLFELNREHHQRSLILKGWKQLGMNDNDIGLLADTDETFTRDFLVAMKVCSNIEIFDYKTHNCNHNKVKLTATTRVFETTPECITNQRSWFHPDMIIGYCIEQITTSTTNVIAHRQGGTYGFLRDNGHGGNCNDWDKEDKITNNSYSLWNAADFRRACGGYMQPVKHKYRDITITVLQQKQTNISTNNNKIRKTQQQNKKKQVTLDQYTGYHFHNFFTDFQATRYKYLTYGHADSKINEKSIPQMSNDLKMMYKCVMEQNDSQDQKWTSIKGGYTSLDPFYPIYFTDSNYRQRRHEHVKTMIQHDDELVQQRKANDQLVATNKKRKEQEQLKKDAEKETTKQQQYITNSTAILQQQQQQLQQSVSSDQLRTLAKNLSSISDADDDAEADADDDEADADDDDDHDEAVVDLTKIMKFYNKRQQKTNTGVDVSDSSLYETINLHGNSSTATVIALASGYDIVTYERFVGTLRKTGYSGHIILGVAPDIDEQSLRYLQYRNVVTKILSWVNCTYMKGPEDTNDIFKQTTCADPYPDIKIRWSRFPLARDWLVECPTCTGPVLVTDARDLLFQLDPFGVGSPPVTGLQVFEEHLNLNVGSPFTAIPIRKCKKVGYKGPMLCSGTTVGTRAAMIKYLDIMYEEMKVWISNIKCHNNFNGDDQAIHNYIYYSGQLPFAVSIVNRMNGIVNTIGHHAAQIANSHFDKYDAQNIIKSKATAIPYDGANNQTWISTNFGVTNEFGQFIEFDGNLSRVIHQWDRFHAMYQNWLRKQSFVKDPIPDDWTP